MEKLVQVKNYLLKVFTMLVNGLIIHFSLLTVRLFPKICWNLCYSVPKKVHIPVLNKEGAYLNKLIMVPFYWMKLILWKCPYRLNYFASCRKVQYVVLEAVQKLKLM